MLDLEYDPKPPIGGGSVKNTDKEIAESMRTMYDMFLLPYVKESDKK
ncbi:MAG: hypothetical protein ABI554_02610 [Flavobacterium sp.]